MSLYNMLHGFNRDARVVLAMLGLDQADIGRFRDAWIEPGGLTAVVMTRTGGGNRDGYRDANAALQSHPLYGSDADDDFDSTFAYFRFAVPTPLRDLFSRLAPTEPESGLREKTERACQAIASMPDDKVPADAKQQIIALIESAIGAEKAEAKP